MGHGIEVKQEDKDMLITQEGYAKDVIKEVQDGCDFNLVKTPIGMWNPTVTLQVIRRNRGSNTL